jgi:hypothetical protein
MAGHQPGQANWSRRYKVNRERLDSREYQNVADVVSELSLLERDHGLSAGERRMLGRARRLLNELPGEEGNAGVREPRRPAAPSGAGSAAVAVPPGPQPPGQRAV